MWIWFTELLQNMLSFRLSVGNLLFYRLQNNTDRNKNIFLLILNEPPRDKTNNVTVRPAKTRISLGIRPVWSESSLCAQWVAKSPSFRHADSEALIRLGGCPGWSESSLGVHSLCWFCHEVAQMSRPFCSVVLYGIYRHNEFAERVFC